MIGMYYFLDYVIIIYEDRVMSIPPGHWMWQELVQPWLDAGNVILPWEEIPAIPGEG